MLTVEVLPFFYYILKHQATGLGKVEGNAEEV